MKIFAYKFHNDTPAISLSDRIQQILTVPIKERNRKQDTQYVRLEHAEQVNGYWLCDFIKIRMDHGPAKGGLKKEVEGFPLDAEEGFSEETAILFDPTLNAVVAQYNHYGPRISAITDYLSIFDHEQPARFMFLPVYADDINRILRRKNIFSKVELSIAPQFMTQRDYDAGVGLKEAMSVSKATGAEKVTLVLSVHGRKRGLHQVKDLLHWVYQKATSQDADAISACRITARDGDDAASERLDLVAQRLSAEVSVKSGADRRYPRAERLNALRRTRDVWRTKLT